MVLLWVWVLAGPEVLIQLLVELEVTLPGPVLAGVQVPLSIPAPVEF